MTLIAVLGSTNMDLAAHATIIGAVGDDACGSRLRSPFDDVRGAGRALDSGSPHTVWATEYAS